MNFIKALFLDQDLRKKFLVILFVFTLYKLGTFVVVPGINRDLLSSIFEQNSSLGVVNLLSGGSLANFSIFAIGVMPYITAMIVLQMLAMDIVPKLAELKKMGEEGQKKMKKLTYILTIILAFVQGMGISLGFNRMANGVVINDTVLTHIMIAFFLTLGTGILLILAEVIERKGIGSGISLIIMASVLMTVPSAVSQLILTEQEALSSFEFMAIAKIAFIGLLLFGLTLVTIQVHHAERRLPVQYAVTKSKNDRLGKQTTFLPIKLNTAGVMPVIFAVSLFMTPVTIANLFPENSFAIWVSQNLTYQEPAGLIMYAIMIIFFTYFYAFIQSNPEEMAENLKRSGGFILGVKPGKPTEEKIRSVLKNLTVVGSLFLTAISIIPIILLMAINLPMTLQIGGISLIIIVSVLIDIKSKIQVDTKKKSYKSFLHKSSKDRKGKLSYNKNK